MVTKDFEGSTKGRIEYCAKTKMDSFVIYELVQGLSGGVPIEPELMGYVCIPRDWKRYIFHRGLLMELPVHIGTWINSGRNGERQISSGRLSNTNESFLDTSLEEEIAHSDFTVPQKVSDITRWRHDQNAVFFFLVRLSRVQEGMEFWQTVFFNHDLRYDTRRLH